MKEAIYVYGKNPLNEGVLASKRNNKQLIQSLYLTKQSEEDPRVMSLVQGNNIPYEIVTMQEIEHMVGRDAVHQGVCATLHEGALYTPLDTILADVEALGTYALFVLLDELQDPHNVGAIIRSAAAFGATAILLPEHNQTQLNGTVIKASSGMNFVVPIVRIGNINTTLTKLKEKGFWTYGLTGDGDTKLTQATFDAHTIIVVGSEGSGIRAKTLELCDFKLSIETSKLCESLNASNALAVTAYEWNRQNS